MAKLTLLAVGILAAGLAGAGEYELKWDDGICGHNAYFAGDGSGCWFANDFNVATVGTRYVTSLKIMSSGTWGNQQWDGFRIALFSFASAPGSIIWPPSGEPKLVVGYGNGFTWCEFNVGWELPPANDAFVGGQEQYYTPPNIDPYGFDSIGTESHTWLKTPSSTWRLANYGYYTDFMLRVIVNDTGVAPASLGRVKALFR